MTHFRFVLNQRSIPLKSQFSLDFRWVFPWSSWRCCNPHQKRLPEAAKKAAERKAAKAHMLWYWRGAIVRYPTGIPLYNYQEWCSCRVSKVGHDPLFFGGVFTNLTLLSCVSVKFVYQRVKFPQSGKESLEMTRWDLGKAVSWDYQWWIFQPQLGCKHKQFGRSSPNSSSPNPRQILHWDHVLSSAKLRNWTHKLCRLIDSDSISF